MALCQFCLHQCVECAAWHQMVLSVSLVDANHIGSQGHYGYDSFPEEIHLKTTEADMLSGVFFLVIGCLGSPFFLKIPGQLVYDRDDPGGRVKIGQKGSIFRIFSAPDNFRNNIR